MRCTIIDEQDPFGAQRRLRRLRRLQVAISDVDDD